MSIKNNTIIHTCNANILIIIWLLLKFEKIITAPALTYGRKPWVLNMKGTSEIQGSKGSVKSVVDVEDDGEYTN